VAGQLRELADWLAAAGVGEVAMESTAQSWKPVWHQTGGTVPVVPDAGAVNRDRRGRNRDFADAERLLRRYLAGELIRSFVPDAEQ
jgi:hypothetical protein